ncbi:hypothetical protein [Tenacibaculum sp. SG-28]|uniref:hypothetical protein n=1 Tax=Tenacibaculum sp. SG-28 TaxID=754426 RepID=UPI000CF4EBF7|nr:hypothetical protein [Tenacibaculum sp. SG-28]PQJ22937.1 hypothetical protein BSU00_01215 [Tenacibaculum sp. SG-28]
MIKKITVTILLLSSLAILAQRNSTSPYSYFGIGENFDPLTVEQASMGGIGVALKDVYHLNFTNPASLADLKVATYAMGGSMSFITIKEEGISDSGSSTSLRYVSLAFPISKNMGFSVGLQPFSSVGYALLNTEYNGEDISKVSRYSGSGGTNRLYAGFGVYLFKGFSLGGEASFIFGSIDKNILEILNEVSRGTQVEENLNIRGGLYKVGAQYQKILKNDLQLSTGASVTFGADLSAKGSERIYSIGAIDSRIRELLDDSAVQGTVTIPLNYTIGVGLGRANKWYAGLNQEFSEAASVSSNVDIPDALYQYEKGSKFSIGGYYIPKFNSISSYWDRITYRAGFRMENIGVAVDGLGTGQDYTSIKDFGINVGVGLPLPKQLSNLNLGFEYGQRGTTDNNLVKEEYFNIKLSLSLNSRNWFKQRKID